MQRDKQEEKHCDKSTIYAPPFSGSIKNKYYLHYVYIYICMYMYIYTVRMLEQDGINLHSHSEQDVGADIFGLLISRLKSDDMPYRNTG